MIFTVGGSSFLRQLEEYQVRVLACLYNIAQASWGAQFPLNRTIRELKTNLNRFSYFFVALDFFLLNSKYPSLCSEAWKSTKNQQEGRCPIYHSGLPADRCTCTHTAAVVCTRAEEHTAGNGRELEVWQGNTSALTPFVCAVTQNQKWCLEAATCTVEDKVLL